MHPQQAVSQPATLLVTKPFSQKFKIKAQQRECPLSHIPNAETIQAIKDANAGVDATVCKDAQELFEYLGI